MPQLQPFFSYFGSKWRAAPHYPKPEQITIVEPFAGSAGYSLRYPQKQVILVDKDPILCGVWDYLIHATINEILELPDTFDDVNDLSIPQEAKWLIGFWLNRATTHPCNKPSSWMRSGEHETSFWGMEKKIRIAAQLCYIRHWQILNTCYSEIDNQSATWFIDPPYQVQGHRYRFSEVDYEHLGEWCKTRQGQVIVCEQYGADWLPFESIGSFKSNHASKTTHEAVWTKSA